MTTEFDHERHTFASPRFLSVVGEVIRFLADTPVQPLPPPQSFIGSGVYALYYTGSLDLYSPLAAQNRDAPILPIYVGKAVPPGWRTARVTLSQTRELYQRLREHTRSIQQTTNLDIKDFYCRFVILIGLESDLVVPVEAELIRQHRPLWNSIVDGFGNHDPGAGRYNQAASEWDGLHPGRSWVGRLTGTPPSIEAIEANVQRFFVEMGLRNSTTDSYS